MVLRPVGSRPAAVYWRRRVVLLAILAVLLLLLVHACGGSPSKGTAAQGSHTVGDTPTTGTTPTTSTLPPAPCGSSGLQIAVTPASTTSTAGEPLRFAATVTSKKSQPCSLQFTPSQQIWTVRSGNVEVWSTAGCPAAKAGLQRTLRPGKPVHLHILWDGHANTSTCGVGNASTAGTYTVRLALGHTASPPATFTLATT
jgi:hypothetical protein